jgi:hypothetical protein
MADLKRKWSGASGFHPPFRNVFLLIGMISAIRILSSSLTNAGTKLKLSTIDNKPFPCLQTLCRNNTNVTTTVAAVVQYPLPPTGGTVHYSTNKYSGWNNQRESAMMAWIIAYYTGHTLEYKTFHPAFTGSIPDQNTYTHADLWDVNLIQKYVHIQNTSHTKEAGHYDLKIKLDSVFLSKAEVRALGNKYHNISYDAGWNLLQKSVPWLNPWKNDGGRELVFERLMESFTYSPLIRKHAEKIVEKIGGPFIGLHVRKGRMPALNCSDYKLPLVSGPETKRHERGGCQGITWNKFFEKQHEFQDSNLPVYVAHDMGRRQGADFMNHEILQSFDFQDIIGPLRPAIVSAIEQVVMIYAEYFVASTQSSWSEYVIYKRAFDKRDGEKNYKIWKSNGQVIMV